MSTKYVCVCLFVCIDTDMYLSFSRRWFANGVDYNPVADDIDASLSVVVGYCNRCQN